MDINGHQQGLPCTGMQMSVANSSGRTKLFCLSNARSILSCIRPSRRTIAPFRDAIVRNSPRMPSDPFEKVIAMRIIEIN